MNKSFWKHEFHDVLVRNRTFKKYSYISWLMDYHNTIRVLNLNSITLFKWPCTNNVTNFAIPSFILINMYGMIYWTWKIIIIIIIIYIYIYICPFVSWFRILSQYDLSIVFFLRFGMVMQYPSKFQKICFRTWRIFWIP